jgi:2,3-bisphosphoglycerate-independent phosphoglycerate mutase
VPESDEAIVSLFGNDIRESSRGQLEARGAGIKLVRGDLALRANFATIDSLEGKNIIDRRVGRTLTTSEAEILAKSLNKIKMPCKFVFQPTVQHRGVLVFRGGFSEDISGNDLTYYKSRSRIAPEKIMEISPQDENDNSQYSANVVNEFLRKAFQVLDKHPINEQRRRKGLMPANYLLVRGAGIETPKLKQYKKWVSVVYMPVEIGFATTSGMKISSFRYPRLKKFDVYKNLNKGLKKACKVSVKTLKRNYKEFDYAYIHLKETDIPGHDNKPLEKKAMIELIDSILFRFLKKFAVSKKIKVIVTGDHSTPCNLKSHSADPVPVLFYDGNDFQINEKKFSETEAMKGRLGKMVGNELLIKTGFAK